jgi:Protein of unknown function (DUF4089)
MFTHASLGAKPRATLRTWDQWDSKRDERAICDDRAMTESQDNPLEAYVRAALALQGYTFEDAEIAEIVMQFARLEAIARTVFDWPLPFASEPAPVFRP